MEDIKLINGNKNFTWIPFYEEFANKLIAYQNNRQELINKIKNIFLEMSNLTLPTLERDNNIIDIDPFTVFGLFNKKIKNNNRLELLSLIKNYFNLDAEIPKDFEGIPVLTPRNSTFYHFVGARGNNDIDDLWNLFNVSLDYRNNNLPTSKISFDKAYNIVKNHKGIKWNITMALFWIAPLKYINLDGPNRETLLKASFISDDIKQQIRNYGDIPPSGENYLSLCEQLSSELINNKNGINNFPSFSSYARHFINNDEEWFPQDYTPEFSIDDWVNILQNPRIFDNNSLKLVKRMYDIGGQASCKQLAEKYGLTYSAYIGYAAGLGQRIHRETNCSLLTTDNDNSKWWVIPFIGRGAYKQEVGTYVWKLRNELQSAIEKVDLSQIELYENGENNMSIPLNQILYGPPGTGKTYQLENMIKDYIYPQVENEQKNVNIFDELLLNYELSWIEKIIFAFKINNSQNIPLTDIQISKLPLIQRWFSISSNYKDEKSLICSIRGEMQKNAIKKEGVYARHENDYFERKENGFILIKDGERIYNELCDRYDVNINSFNNSMQIDKSIFAKDYYSFCTFHQSYSYEEFIEGIRPVINKNKQDEITKNKDLNNMQFDFHCGIFKDMCIKAKKEPNKKFFIFIDEINRGNISRIFGELITLIEKDKREKVFEDGKEYHTIEVTLPYTNDKFTVPNNLYIVGTMNTADKSLALLDVALRRRFEFIPMYPRYDIENLKHKEFFEALNDRIYFEKKSADFLIGHTYFLGDEAEDLSEVMNKNVTPLLMEYFSAKKEKVEEIVGPLLEKEGYCIDKNEKYLLKVVKNR